MEKMEITFINVGYGEAVLISCPDPSFRDGTFRMLVDGGSKDDSEFSDRSSGRIPLPEYFRLHSPGHLDLAVNTHIHEDHTSGFTGIEPLPSVLWQTYPADFWKGMRRMDDGSDILSVRKFIQSLNDYLDFCRRLEENGSRIEKRTASSEEIQLCAGLTARILAPSEMKADRLTAEMKKLYEEPKSGSFGHDILRLDTGMNNHSLVLMLQFGKTKVLLPGDTNAGGFQDIPGDIRADIFKIGHHGQKDAVSEELLERVSPAHIVCCASSDRRYESADPGKMDLIRSRGIRLWFSDCPEGQEVPPHQELKITADREGNIECRYC